MNRKWDLAKVKELFESKGLTLLSNEYTNTKEKLNYIALCGHEYSNNLDNIKADKGLRCKGCRYNAVSNNHITPFEEVKKYFSDNGCLLSSKEYKDHKKKLHYVAQCGHKNLMTFGKFKNGAGRVCNKCSKSIKYEYDYVSEYFMNNDCVLLEETYINGKTQMKYIAKCGHIHYISFDTFKNCPNASMKCPECQMTKRVYGPVQARNKYDMKKWAKDVYKRDNFDCVKCGKHGGKLNAHHLNSFNSDSENRFNLDNGVTLCEPCHQTFHKVYGYGLNTKEQFDEWLYGNTEVKRTLKGVAHRNA